MPPAEEGRLDQSIAAGVRRLQAAQRPDGPWESRVESHAQVDARYLVFTRLIGRPRPEVEPALVERLRALQQADGGWAVAPGEPGHLATSAEAYLALRATGTSPDDPALVRAREFIRGRGGLARVGIATRAWLASAGQFPWWGVPSLPVEAVLLPESSRAGLHALSGAIRCMVVPMALLAAQRPAASLADTLRLDELWLRPPSPEDLAPAPAHERVSWRNAGLILGRALARVEPSPWKPFRRRGVARAIEWLLRRQGADGRFGGTADATMLAVLALHAVGFARDHPVIMRGLQGLDDLITRDGGVACQPAVLTVRDTALAVRALLAAGVAPTDPTLVHAGGWLVRQQATRPGDWSARAAGLEPGGWAAQPGNSLYPRVDDSSQVLLALYDLNVGASGALRRALAFGGNWTLAMQSHGGGYGAYDVDGGAGFLPPALTDPPAADVTGQALCLMARAGFDAGLGRARRAVEFLRRTQDAAGAWRGRWAVHFLHGTAAALSGLAAIGTDVGLPWVRRAIAWLGERQNSDGGFGETIASYDDPSQAGRGPSTVSQTAWVLEATLATDGPRSPTVVRAADHLLATQDADGAWSETAFTLTAVPGYAHLRASLQPHALALSALGQYRAALARREDS